MLSYQAIGASHPGQCEPGCAIDSPRGSRQMATLAKLPKSSPNRVIDSEKYHPGIGNDTEEAFRHDKPTATG